MSSLMGSQILLRWAYKSLALLGSILLLYYHSGLWSYLVFGVVALWVFFTESSERKQYKSSFFILVFLIFLLGFGIGASDGTLSSFIVIFCVGILFSLLLGIINPIFGDSRLIYGISSNLIIFSSIILLGSIKLNQSWFSGVSIFIISLLLLKENAKLEGMKAKQSLILSAIPAFLLMEFFWLSFFMPLNFLSQASLLVLFFLILRHLIEMRIKGELNARLALREAVILIVFILFIFMTSKWRI